MKRKVVIKGERIIAESYQVVNNPRSELRVMWRK